VFGSSNPLTQFPTAAIHLSRWWRNGKRQKVAFEDHPFLRRQFQLPRRRGVPRVVDQVLELVRIGLQTPAVRADFARYYDEIARFGLYPSAGTAAVPFGVRSRNSRYCMSG